MGILKFTEQTIVSVAKTTLDIARKFVYGLCKFGVNEAYLNRFEEDIKTADELPGEPDNVIVLQDKTNHKNAVLDACYQWGNSLRLRVELAFEPDTNEAINFPSKKLEKARYSERRMMPLMKTLIDLSRKYNPQLMEYGQTAEDISEGEELSAQLKLSDEQQELNKEEKKGATQERYLVFSRLYHTVNKINKVGRVVFRHNVVKLALFKSKWPRSVDSGNKNDDNPVSSGE